MKSFIFLNIFGICFTPLTVFSQNKFETVGIPMLKAAVLKSFPIIDKKPECPESGTKSVDKVMQDQGSATSGKSIVSSLIDKTQESLTRLESESGKCGSCQQINQVAIYTTSEPAKIVQNASCDNMPTVNLQMNLSDNDIHAFIEATISGNTPEGKKIYQSCPDPCSFYTAVAVTPLEQNRRLVNLTAHCGQPRAGSLLFAKYKFSSGLIHKWSCQ